MKKPITKILAIVGLIAIAGFAYHKFAKHTPKNSATDATVTTEAKKDVPTDYIVSLNGLKEQGVKYWTDGKTFFKQAFGPLVKSTHQTISESEYVNSYSA